METTKSVYTAVQDESGEDYYCPVEASGAELIDTEVDLDDCVEASTAGRYSGNLTVVNRFAQSETTE
jgi:hypothetical protein